MTGLDLLLAGVGLLAVGAGWAVVATNQVVRAGLWLVVCLGALAVEFLLLGAELVAWTQVLIYLGAVVVLLLFAVMLTRAPIGPSQDLDRRIGPASVVGVGVGLSLGTLFAVAYGWTRYELPAQHGNAETVGGPIFTTWALPFEVVSVLLLGALIGAVVVSRGAK
ncbi:NADH:ubiquinone oxidoreductase subunit 6 (subunit J) [Hamadaea flava]|uniref:NADH-quinone oxidoreductase subunit J n=1 Tax=Hamadaea flava TaxID=1742688 RepID=A0ABV8LFJ1_9ACTN|nr:NADH-quinone oxidoreductase subunit J [Hamadaea flava]MCP2326417.1 NADH:ubiquinone oxidoreductase subunit 6 (subunit J) [Hamadaea flava]